MRGPMKKCLIVDDSRVIRKVARKILEELQFGVDEAEDGAAALEICRRKMPDAILLDWNMPTMSGVDFLRALRREPSGGRPIVVYCTSENDLTVITEAMGAGRERVHHEAIRPGNRDRDVYERRPGIAPASAVTMFVDLTACQNAMEDARNGAAVSRC